MYMQHMYVCICACVLSISTYAHTVHSYYRYMSLKLPSINAVCLQYCKVGYCTVRNFGGTLLLRISRMGSDLRNFIREFWLDLAS